MLTLLAQEVAKPSGLVTMVPLLLMAGGLYFLMIRPQQKRQRAQREMVQELGVGDEVVTIGGIYGTIRAIDEETDDVILEVGPGLTLRMLRGAIARPIADSSRDDDDEDDDDDDDDDEEDSSSQQVAYDEAEDEDEA